MYQQTFTGLLAWASAALLGARPETPVPEIKQWAVTYAAVPEPAALSGLDLVALEPDLAPDLRRVDARAVGYLSLGQINRSRPYWREARDAGFLVEPSASWPDAWRVDPRSAAWQAMVLNEIAPFIIERGFQGFLLDTLDDADFLDTHGFTGARAAMGQLVARLRRRFPSALIVANGGLSLLPDIAPQLDALVVESVWTGYDFGAATYFRRTPGEAAARAATLREVRAQTGLPVLPLEYAALEDAPTRAWIYETARSAGFDPYVSTIALDRIIAEATR